MKDVPIKARSIYCTPEMIYTLEVCIIDFETMWFIKGGLVVNDVREKTTENGKLVRDFIMTNECKKFIILHERKLFCKKSDALSSHMNSDKNTKAHAERIF